MANTWQLYSDKPGWRQAHVALTAALQAALRGKRRGSVEDGQAVYREWLKAADEWISFGARDTEPECVALDKIEDALSIERGTLCR